ncbi:MAG: Rab family GTPase [Myxococcota bacterium]
MWVFKVCLVGAFAVGKSSLARRFVSDVFSDRYLTTIGVRIEKRALEVDGASVRLAVWDIHGEDRFQSVDSLYLRGAAGIALVVDPTRPDTVQVATELSERARRAAPEAVQIVLLNKLDLRDDWRPEVETVVDTIGAEAVHRVSAKTGEGVEGSFDELTRSMLKRGR